MRTPRYEHTKTYKVTVYGHPSQEALEEWQNGVWLSEGKTAPCYVKVLDSSKGTTTLRIVMIEGKKRQIRRIAAKLDHPVKKLMRTHIGQLGVGTLRRGEWYKLSDEEVHYMAQPSWELDLIRKRRRKLQAERRKKTQFMSASSTIQHYVARQPNFAWRRRVIRWMIRNIGFRLLARMHITGLENIPASGPVILMMNHLSAIDPVVCMGAVTERFVIPMSKIENSKHPLLGFFVWAWGAYTVDRTTVDRAALMNSIELLKSEQMILIAPEGTRHPDGLELAKDGMTYIATKADAIILPAALSGTQHFKRHWKRLRPVPAHLHFGPPFRLRLEGRTRIPRDELAQMTREAMYQLALAIQDPALRGAYANIDQATTHTLEFIKV